MENKKNEEKEVQKVCVKVLTPFLDKFDTSVRYEAGTMLELDADRAENVISRGLAELSDPIG